MLNSNTSKLKQHNYGSRTEVYYWTGYLSGLLLKMTQSM